MLSERQALLLKEICSEYIKTAHPIGSKALTKKFKCSSATLRNDMMLLESMGYLEKQHISSGRIPSEKGYRYYVDHLMEPKKISGSDMLKLQTIFSNRELDLNDAITKSLEIISDITNYTSVVLGSASKENNLEKVEVIPITDNRLIAIVVTDKGHVENKIINLEESVEAKEVSKTSELLNKMLKGTPISEVSAKLEFEIKPIIGNYVKNYEVLYNAFYEALSNFQNEKDVHWEGKSNILKQPEFSTVDDVKNIISKFENKELVSKIEETDEEVKVYIGTETSLDDNVTVIKTKYKALGKVGTLAIIGPKRMDYERVLNLLEYIKSEIERKVAVMNNESKKGKPKKENKSEKLYNEINELKEKVSLLEDKNKRTQAEFINYMARTDKEKASLLKYDGEKLIKKILDVTDDFERAIMMDDNDLSDEVSNFLKGFKMIYTRLIGVLDEMEVKPIDVEGKEFDPSISEAVLTEHDETKPENVVLEVLKKGYTYKDKLVRPAMVKVNK